MSYPTYVPSRHFFPSIQTKMLCPAFIPKVPSDEHRDLSTFVLDPRTFTLPQLSQMLQRLCMEVNWDFFNANIELISKSCADDASALGVPISADSFEILWNEVTDVYLGYLRGMVMRGQGFDILEIVPRDRETGWLSTTAVRILGFTMQYFVGCKFGWIGDRFQSTVKALLDGEDFSAYIKQHCHENGLDYWEGNGQTWNRLNYLTNYYRVTGDLSASTGWYTDESVLTRWR